MILTTTDSVPGKRIAANFGVVKGNAVRARHLGSDVLAGLKNLVGGEIEEYTKLMAESREQALDRMAQSAAALRADAIVSIRFSTSMVMQHAAEILVYGTAVRLEDQEGE
jgi:uncharacterized protein YbjQ (UPF0145 family)